MEVKRKELCICKQELVPDMIKVEIFLANMRRDKMEEKAREQFRENFIS